MKSAFRGDFGKLHGVADEFETFGVGGEFDDAPFERDHCGIDEIFRDGEETQVGVSGAADVFQFAALGGRQR